ncbi:unnamed protein product [Durusdinium trenchii]|uniref:3-hydroxyisobutyryl-CoA hydrolase n=1 Tax=Durusdinium trenchii TaxID=1381693 RepID=A0ABP0ILL1_9DINO
MVVQWQNSEQVVKEILQCSPARCSSGTWSYDNVKFSIEDDIAQVKLDDARTGNALRHKTVRALLDLCIELHRRPEVKVVVFTASGFYFSSGGAFGADIPEDDINFAPKLKPGASQFDAGVAENLLVAHLLYLLSTLPQYKVAAIRGSILGAGISLVAAMDYVLAPESRTQLSFKEATRGLGACCSWQATIAKLGVRTMRRLCLLAADVNAFQAKELKLVDEIIAGPTSQAFGEADARALAKAQQVASWTTEERHARKCTGPGKAQPLELCGGLMTEAADLEALLEEVLSSSVVPRLGPARFSKEMWPHKAVKLHMAGQQHGCEG